MTNKSDIAFVLLPEDADRFIYGAFTIAVKNNDAEFYKAIHERFWKMIVLLAAGVEEQLFVIYNIDFDTQNNPADDYIYSFMSALPKENFYYIQFNKTTLRYKILGKKTDNAFGLQIGSSFKFKMPDEYFSNSDLVTKFENLSKYPNND